MPAACCLGPNLCIFVAGGARALARGFLSPFVVSCSSCCGLAQFSVISLASAVSLPFLAGSNLNVPLVPSPYNYLTFGTIRFVDLDDWCLLASLRVLRKTVGIHIFLVVHCLDDWTIVVHD